MKLSVSQSVASSAFFIGFGCIVLWLCRDMQIGTAAEMGVGYVPLMLGAGSIGVGALRLILGLMAPAADERAVIELRPLLFVPLLIACFAGLLPVLGLPISVALMVLATIASGEAYDVRWLLATAVVLSAGTAVLFITLLQLQIPLWIVWGRP